MTRRAKVLFKDRQAGWLEELPTGGTQFSYLPRFDTSIACSLPISHRVHQWPQGLHPFFENLTSEGWLREAQARTAHLDQQDAFGLLVRYGRDCIGAVSVLAEQPDETENQEAAVNPGRTLSGVQRKLLVAKNDKGTYQPASAHGPAPYLAKFSRNEYPDLVRNEALSLRWTRKVLGEKEVTEFELGTVELNPPEQALIVKRFDRAVDGSKLRLEELAQVLNVSVAQKYTGGSYEDAAAAIAKHSDRPKLDLARYFRRLLSYAIIGNCDAHLKNFALLETTEGLRLSPAYDVVNVAVYTHLAPDLGLKMGGRNHSVREVTKEPFMTFGLEIGLTRSAIDQAFKSIRRGVRKADPIIRPHKGEPPDGFVHRFEAIVRDACLRILPE